MSGCFILGRTSWRRYRVVRSHVLPAVRAYHYHRSPGPLIGRTTTRVRVQLSRARVVGRLVCACARPHLFKNNIDERTAYPANSSTLKSYLNLTLRFCYDSFFVPFTFGDRPFGPRSSFSKSSFTCGDRRKLLRVSYG